MNCMDKDNQSQYQRPPPNEQTNKDILKGQYAIAVDLYKHEDDLNWKKLHNLFYVTGALLFILSMISDSIETFPNDIDPSILGILSMAGVLISSSFAIAIRSGVTYLQARKAKVIEIEQKLKDFGGISIVGEPTPILRVSPTTIMLKFLPLVFTCGWLILLCYSVVNLLHLLP